MTALVATVLVASLAGSLHCVGMCGGLVAAYAGGAGGGVRFADHLAYHLSRLLGYATLGVIAGSVGAAIDVAGSMAGVQRTAIVLAGGVMVLWGGAELLRSFGVKLRFGHLGASRVGRLVRRASAGVSRRPPVVRATVLGLVTALLPCGWLYAFVVMAAGTGHPLYGAVVMTAFWMGTVPALAGIGVAVRWLTRHLGRHVATVMAVLIMAVGIWTIVSRASITRPMTAHAAGREAPAEPAPQKVPEPGAHDCHGDG